MLKFTLIILLCFINISTFAQQPGIIDSRHYSNVFGETRNFRIFLPPGYAEKQKRFPVIYFFHGWGQRYFGEGSEEYAGYDKGEQNKGDNIANYVSKHNVIVVKADGYNRRTHEEYYRRPYNVSPVESYRQFPIYFPELVKYIDDHYRTIADRQHRAISGLSMGGFMTFFLAAKYPDMVSSAGSFCGSPEFTIGPVDFPVEYRHMDMYKNFEGVNVRLHYGDKDFIRSYHYDMNKMWYQVMDNYHSKVFDAEHSTCGLGEMFDTIMNTFEHPLPIPARWTHTEVYPAFTVWNYKITSDRTVPGFTVLENVDKRGFRSVVREFVPDGSLIQNVQLMITTAPLYEKNQPYMINDLDLNNNKRNQYTLQSDDEGRLMITVNGSIHEIGINKKMDKPQLAVADVTLHDVGWATQGREIKLGLRILNKGMAIAKNVHATISPFRKNVKVIKGDASIGVIGLNEIKGAAAVSFISNTDSIEIIKLRVDIKDDNNNQWTEYIDVPVKKQVQEIKDFEIADGRIVSVVRSGVDIESILLGKGNGDGIANRGETIVVLVKDSGKLWRTDLTFSDRYLNQGDVVSRKSDNWTNMDHVGGSAKYDEVLISAEYPHDSTVETFAEYWLPRYPMHIIKQGVIKFKVSGKDATPPTINDIQLHGDNVIEVKITDGSNISDVSAKLIKQNEFEKMIDLQLKDDGKDGDKTANDHIYSMRLHDQKFGIYRIIVEAADSSGNKSSREGNGSFVAH
ncbi:MAG TPA: alpha/beta hydrolase-fold protein [Flavitalea sp.]|nr:alpha/beta hydrolase-fold protein [Flavitalea sp.]